MRSLAFGYRFRITTSSATPAFWKNLNLMFFYEGIGFSIIILTKTTLKSTVSELTDTLEQNIPVAYIICSFTALITPGKIREEKNGSYWWARLGLHLKSTLSQPVCCQLPTAISTLPPLLPHSDREQTTVNCQDFSQIRTAVQRKDKTLNFSSSRPRDCAADQH